MRPVQSVFQKLSRTEQRREGVAAYLGGGGGLITPPLSTTFPAPLVLGDRHLPGLLAWGGRGTVDYSTPVYTLSRATGAG